MSPGEACDDMHVHDHAWCTLVSQARPFPFHSTDRRCAEMVRLAILDVLTFGELLGLFSFHVPGGVLLVDRQSVLHPSLSLRQLATEAICLCAGSLLDPHFRTGHAP